MSTAPPKNPVQKTATYALAAATAAVFVLCGGFFAMALATQRILSNAQPGAFAEPTKPLSTAATTDPVAKGSPARQAADAFLEELRKGDVGTAHGMGTAIEQNREPLEDFRLRIKKHPALVGWSRRQIGSAGTPTEPRTENFRGEVSGPNGRASFTLKASQEEDGWRVADFKVINQ